MGILKHSCSTFSFCLFFSFLIFVFPLVTYFLKSIIGEFHKTLGWLLLMVPVLLYSISVILTKKEMHFCHFLIWTKTILIVVIVIAFCRCIFDVNM